MHTTPGIEVEVIVPAIGDPEAISTTLDGIAAQRSDGLRLSVTVVVTSRTPEGVREISAGDISFRHIESGADSPGGMLQTALHAARSEMIAIVSPGEVLSPGSLLKMARALRDDGDADIACVPSRPADLLLDPPYVPAQDAHWPHATTAYDVRTRWWMCRSSFRGTLVRRAALPKTLSGTGIGRDTECGALLELQSGNPRVIFVAGGLVSMHYADEYQSRLFRGSAEMDWYREPIEESWPRWLAGCADDTGVPRFVQGLALLAVAARFSANSDNLNKHLLVGDGLERFRDASASVLASVDDALILSPESRKKLGLSSALALALYLTKHRAAKDSPVYADIRSDGRGCLTVDGHVLEPHGEQRAGLYLIDHDPATGELIMDGRVNGLAWLADTRYAVRVSIVRRAGDAAEITDIPLEPRGWYALTKYFGVATTKTYAFRVRVPVPDDLESLAIAFVCGDDSEPMHLVFSGHFSRLGRHPRRAWWSFGRYYMFYRHAQRSIVVEPRGFLRMLKGEVAVLLSLLRTTRPEPRRAYDRRAALVRLAYWLTYPLYARKPRWFFVDKVYKAGDSAEYLYRYASARDDGIVKDYVIDGSSGDHARLVADGYRPLKAGSLRHLLAFLHADLVFASNSTVCSLNGLKAWRSGPYRGLIHFDTVCVQHGLSVQNIAVAQNRLVDNTRLYLLASSVEKENLSRPIYAYDDYPDALQVTGVPRYDGLVSDDRKQILIHPTWRMQFATPVTTHEGETRAYNPAFKDSEYFKVYSSLISNERLIRCAEETGYRIKFVLHPLASSQAGDFHGNESVEVIGASGRLDYEEVLSQSSLMVTDFSGVQFDFAYMRKPVVYFQPPELPPHYQESTFSYDTMAFGEICPDESGLVDLLCGYMQGGCRMKPGYEERMDSFFAFGDRRNCERSYRAALDYMKVRSERR